MEDYRDYYGWGSSFYDDWWKRETNTNPYGRRATNRAPTHKPSPHARQRTRAKAKAARKNTQRMRKANRKA